MTSTLSHWYFDWILWLQWFQWRHSLFKLRPIEKRIAFVFCQRRNKLGIMHLSALFYSRSTLFMVFAVALLLARADSLFHADFHRHGKVASRSTLPLLPLVQSYTPKFSFLWGYVTFLVLKCRNPILVITCIVHTDTYTNKGSWKWFFSKDPQNCVNL